MKIGTAILNKTTIDMKNIRTWEEEDIELIMVNIWKYTITAVYKPPDIMFSFLNDNP